MKTTNISTNHCKLPIFVYIPGRTEIHGKQNGVVLMKKTTFFQDLLISLTVVCLTC